ncbi:hypothetical protein VB780_21325 [Leptolyngbya sp. CCNP1308]|uniref:hypothetical protein n=1 Tax=Leptolyngbya sp. CCNP1308 TaxID=3110255 RepID=UPI002B219D15|nr:hypothetical protein [Leptolyngbya sp. CCNP1308]MEA5451135.1 hypothetical protein [Leptolyngbya sp. CCNP1308]
MHPSSPCSLMTRLACAASLGLMMTTAPLGLSALHASFGATSQAAAGAEDDRGSGRLSRVPVIADWLSFRGSGRVAPTPPPSHGWGSPVAYRGSGRITEPRTA